MSQESLTRLFMVVIYPLVLLAFLGWSVRLYRSHKRRQK